MIVENTQEFPRKEAAEDCLAGLAGVPGFMLGYVRLPRTPSQLFAAVTVFDCAGGNLSSGQQAVEGLRVTAQASLTAGI